MSVKYLRQVACELIFPRSRFSCGPTAYDDELGLVTDINRAEVEVVIAHATLRGKQYHVTEHTGEEGGSSVSIGLRIRYLICY